MVAFRFKPNAGMRSLVPSVPNLWLGSGEWAKLLSGPSLSRVLGSNFGSAFKVANFYRLRDSSWRKTLGSNFGGDSSAFSGSSFFGDGSSAKTSMAAPAMTC